MTQQSDIQKKPPRGDFSKIAMRVRELRDITQISGQFDLKLPSAQPPFKAVVSMPETQVVQKKDEDGITVIADFVFEGRLPSESSPEYEQPREDAAKDVVIQISATYMVRYKIDPGPDLEDEDLRAFARVNGVLNLWPFWREYVHSTLCRADLSPFPLPPFNPVKFGRDAVARRKNKEDSEQS